MLSTATASRGMVTAPHHLAALERAGHLVEVVEPFSELMGHAGALVRRPSGVIEGAADPRGDGGPAGF